MRFLVIGASGFIGRHILAYTKSLSHKSLGTQSGSKHSGLISFNLLNQRIRDCIEDSFFENDEHVFVVLCAAISQIDRCLREKEISYKVNVENTIRLIQDLETLKVKPVFLSTGSVYDGSIGYYNEELPPCPICEYGRHKAAVEDYIRDNVPNALVLRLDKVLGDDPSERHLFTDWYQRIEEARPIACIEGQLFSPTLVKDVAKAVFLGCQEDLSGVYNVANPEFFTRDELARQFVMAVGKKAEIICKPQEAFNFLDQRPLKSYLDSTKFIKATGMRFTSMRELFKTFVLRIQQVQKIALIF